MKYTKKFMVVPYREDYFTTTKKLANPDLNKNLPFLQDNKDSVIVSNDNKNNDLVKVQDTLNIILSNMQKNEPNTIQENKNAIFEPLFNTMPIQVAAKKSTPKKPLKRKMLDVSLKNESYNYPIAKHTRTRKIIRKNNKVSNSIAKKDDSLDKSDEQQVIQSIPSIEVTIPQDEWEQDQSMMSTDDRITMES